MDAEDFRTKFGKAVHEELKTSARINGVIAEAKAAGLDVFLIVEVTMGFRHEPDAEKARDADFLKQLRIKVD